ncbi:MAG: major outer sheath protein Msp [Treponema sp.]
MKKCLLVSFTALFVAAALAADPATLVEPKIDVEAEATVTWGIDLGAGTNGKFADRVKHGFKNEASWKVTFPIIKKGDLTSSKTDVPVYGEIILKDVELALKSVHDKNDKKFDLSGKVDKIEGKVVFYGAYLTVYNKPSFKTNYANLWKPLERTRSYDEKPFEFKPGFDGFGTKIGYANKDLLDLDVGVKLGSNGDWEAKDATHSKYGVGFDFAMKPLGDLLGVKFNANSTLAKVKDYKNGATAGYNGDSMALNVGAELLSKPIDGLSVKLGFDGAGTKFKNGRGESFAWDGLFNTTFKWISAGVYLASDGTPYQGTNAAGKNTMDMGAYVKFETDDEKDEKTGKLKPSYLMDGLEAGVYLGAHRLLSHNATGMTMPMLGKVWGAYKLMLGDSFWIKPFADYWVESNHTEGLNGAKLSTSYFGMAYDLGLAYSPAEKVEITATWEQGKTAKNKYPGKLLKNDYVIETPFNYANHNGTFTLACKVEY